MDSSLPLSPLICARVRVPAHVSRAHGREVRGGWREEIGSDPRSSVFVFQIPVWVCLKHNSSTKYEMFNIDGYNLIQANRVNKKGGGVGIYINNNYDYIIRSDLSNSTPEYESLFIELVSKNKKSIVLGCIYRAPNTELDAF